MTNEEAIQIIEEKLDFADVITWDYFTWVLNDESIEALRLAIEALKKTNDN